MDFVFKESNELLTNPMTMSVIDRPPHGVRFCITNTLGEQHAFYMNVEDFQKLIFAGKELLADQYESIECPSKTVAVIWSYDYARIIGSANVDDKGNVTVAFTDPRIVEAVNQDKLRALSIGLTPARPAHEEETKLIKEI